MAHLQVGQYGFHKASQALVYQVCLLPGLAHGVGPPGRAHLRKHRGLFDCLTGSTTDLWRQVDDMSTHVWTHTHLVKRVTAKLRAQQQEGKRRSATAQSTLLAKL